MKLTLLFSLLLFLNIEKESGSFRKEQMNFTRVREAYVAKEKLVAKNLSDNHISRDSVRIYLQAFKSEKKLEVWAKNICDTAYLMIKEIPICEMSGDLGPKRRVRDLQVPEGFYYISDLNPYSKYYLSMQINYPNASDSIRGYRKALGNYIFIHGDCISSGCIAINDEHIKELFVYCIEAYNAGQKQIDMAIYPARLTDAKLKELSHVYRDDADAVSLWADLKKSYDYFNSKKNPPTVRFLPDGTHEIR